MKFNWGTGVVIAFILFISFILFFVVKMNTNEMYQHDLVSKDYYKKELEYQQKINNAHLAISKEYSINTKNSSDGFLVVFPKQLESNKITGNISMYRPSNKKLDFTTPIVLDNLKMVIPKEKLPDGRWDIEINWNYKSESYYYKRKLNLQ